MISRRYVCRVGVLLGLVAAAASGQTNISDWNAVKSTAAGTEVRVAAGSRTVRGKLDGITEDALVLISAKGQETFDRQQVTEVSVRKPGHRKRNTLIGLAAGSGVGLAIGIAARARPNQLQVVSNSAVTAGFTVVGALVGTVVGVAIPSGGWREIYKKK